MLEGCLIWMLFWGNKICVLSNKVFSEAHSAFCSDIKALGPLNPVLVRGFVATQRPRRLLSCFQPSKLSRLALWGCFEGISLVLTMNKLKNE